MQALQQRLVPKLFHRLRSSVCTGEQAILTKRRLGGDVILLFFNSLQVLISIQFKNFI